MIPLPPRGQCAKRLSILDAAADVFCRHGFAGASIDLIAAAAGVSRQTVYNHLGDKQSLFAAVVKDATERSNARLYATLTTFPDRPRDIEAELIGFARRLVSDCLCNRECKTLLRLVQNEGERHPELFAAWRDYGPGKSWSALSARLAKLAHAGFLELRDPDLAARQFLALISADLQSSTVIGQTPSEAEIDTAATNAVRTFLRAFGPTSPAKSPRRSADALAAHA